MAEWEDEDPDRWRRRAQLAVGPRREAVSRLATAVRTAEAEPPAQPVAPDGRYQAGAIGVGGRQREEGAVVSLDIDGWGVAHSGAALPVAPNLHLWCCVNMAGDSKDQGEVGSIAAVHPHDSQSSSASVLIDGEEFEVSPAQAFVFGRVDGEGVVGLDAGDMGISAVAGSLESAWGVWWVVNQSTKRALILEHPTGPGQFRLAPGHRHALTSERMRVLVPGAIYTHVLEVVLPGDYAEELRGGNARLTTGTLTAAAVALSDRERDALAALCAGYLRAFPHRREHPHTYEEAARLLGGDPWNADKVRKATERVKDRFANKGGLYFEGPQANYELAAHLISSGILSGEDLGRLAERPRS